MFVALVLVLASGQAATAAPSPAPAKEKKVCRLVEQTGSIMRARTCHTKDEWASIDQRNTEDAQRMSDQRERNGGRPGSPSL